MTRPLVGVAAVWLCSLLTIQTAAAAEWGYEGESGPDYWSSLSDANVLCATGAEQSPIDLVATSASGGVELERQIGQSRVTLSSRAHVMDLVDNGHTIQITSDAAVSLRLDDQDYHLVQFHFHAPSEHTLGGRRLPLESHFVMANEDGGLAVLGVLYDQGRHDPAFDPILAALPDGPDDARHLENLDLDLESLKPLPRRYLRYKGSLTTPPCTENVEWIIVAEVQLMGDRQIDALAARLHDNYRPLQPSNGRQVRLFNPARSGAR